METTINRSPEIGQLALALSVAQGQIENATKNAESHHNKYANLAAVWDACRTPLSQNKLSVVQLPETTGQVVKVTTILMHESGQWIQSTLTMICKKDGPQDIGSCISYARRYSLSAILGIASEDDDGNKATGNNGNASQERQQTAAQAALERQQAGQAARQQQQNRPAAATPDVAKAEATCKAFMDAYGFESGEVEVWVGKKRAAWTQEEFDKLRQLFSRTRETGNTTLFYEELAQKPRTQETPLQALQDLATVP